MDTTRRECQCEALLALIRWALELHPPEPLAQLYRKQYAQLEAHHEQHIHQPTPKPLGHI